MRWAGLVALMGEKRNACKVFVVKPKGKRPLGRLGHTWEDNIKTALNDEGLSDGLLWLRIGTSGELFCTC
jgi:hypothetical protein